MTNDTKKRFDAPWLLFSDPDNEVFQIETNSGDFVAETMTFKQGNRISHLPELYDALAESTRDYCSDCVEQEIGYKNIPGDYDVIESGCPFKYDGKCPPLRWIELLRKVR